jgi:hypothetical protein
LTLVIGLVVWSTSFLLNRRGLGDTFDLFGSWLESIKPLGTLTSPLNLLLSYEPLILIIGFAGLVYALTYLGTGEQERRIQTLSAIWVIVAVTLYSIAEDKSPDNLAVLIVPLALLAGWFIGELIERATISIKLDGGAYSMVWKELPVGILVVLFASFIYLQIAMWISNGRLLLTRDPVNATLSDSVLLIGLIVLSVLVIGLFAFALMGGLRGGNFAAIAVISLLAVGTIRGDWLLNFSVDDVTNEPIAEAQSSHQVFDLTRDLTLLSEWRTNDPHMLTVQVESNLTPVLQWYFRIFPNAQFVNIPTPTPTMNAVITGVSKTNFAPDWISQTYRVEGSWQAQSFDVLGIWRWIIFRQGGNRTWQSIKLWSPAPH